MFKKLIQSHKKNSKTDPDPEVDYKGQFLCIEKERFEICENSIKCTKTCSPTGEKNILTYTGNLYDKNSGILSIKIKITEENKNVDVGFGLRNENK